MAIVRQLENELDIAVERLRRIEAEIEDLREQLKEERGY